MTGPSVVALLSLVLFFVLTDGAHEVLHRKLLVRFGMQILGSSGAQALGQPP